MNLFLVLELELSFYFNRLQERSVGHTQFKNSKEHDLVLEKELAELVPNYKWSVKNQARMHIFNEEQAYDSIEDALSKWPETATAIAVKLKDDGSLEIVAPFGFSDLFRLLVIPTPHFTKKLQKYKMRLAKKNWSKNWPKLRLVSIDGSNET